MAAVAVAAALALVSVPVAGARAELKPPVVAVVDFQLILHESSAGKVAQKAIETQRDAYAKEISGQEEKLRQTEQDLGRQRGSLSEEAFTKKRRDFEKQVNDFQRDVQARQKALQQGEGDALRVIQGAVNDIVTSLAGERGLNLVLPKNVVPFSDPNLDMTQEVLDRLNRKLPSVAVNIKK